MKEAVLGFSRKGQFKEKISAFDIQSREHARKLWPLVTPDQPHELVTYVRPSFDMETNEVTRRSHFARLPRGKRRTAEKQFREEAEAWHKQRAESTEHARAKELIAKELASCLQNTKSLVWCFADKSRSDFPIKGDLLLGAELVQIEYPLETPFDKNYKLDIAVLGPKVDDQILVLAGIEIELSHSFDGYKALISKTLGFPLISVDIAEMPLEAITPEWAADIIQTTTLTAEEGRRKTYFYLHDLIYPQFVSYPLGFLHDPKHQYLVFASDDDITRLNRQLKDLSRQLGYAEHEIAITRVTDKSEQSRKQLLDLGVVVGADWKEINPKQCLRVALDRPASISDLRAHQFHSVMARTILSELNVLVGYKYMGGIQNSDAQEDIWIHSQWQGPHQDPLSFRMLPKRLADPISSIFALIKELQTVGED